VPVARAMIREFATLAPNDTLGTAAKRTLEGFQDDFPVVTDRSVVSVLPRNELLSGLAEAGTEGHVEDFMRTDFATAEPDEMVEVVFERLKGEATPVLPVVHGHELVGLLTSSNVAELVMIREAVRKRKVSSLPVAAERTE
jgi:predicted transcriptional regulator